MSLVEPDPYPPPSLPEPEHEAFVIEYPIRPVSFFATPRRETEEEES